MRNLFTIFIFLPLTFYAQQTAIFKIDSLPQAGVLLDKNWKYHAGDNPDFAKPEFDDSAWENIDPSKDLKEIPQLWKTDIGWFRFKFDADTSLVNKSIALLVAQTGASEIFLNGQLIGTFGKISTQENQTIAVMPDEGSFIGLPIRKKGEQVLSVRFTVQKNLHYINVVGRENITLKLTTMETSAIGPSIMNNPVVYFEFTRIGIFFTLSIIMLALYFFNRSQKASLYFFLYTFFALISTFLLDIVYRNIDLAATRMGFFIGFAVSWSLSFVFFITAVYEIFNRKRGGIFWIFIAFTIASLIFEITDYKNVLSLTGNYFYLIFFAEIIRVVILAKSQKLLGANIIFTGAIIYVIFVFISKLFLWGYIPAGPNWIYGNFAYNIFLLCLPVSISIFLALESSFASRALKLKLEENEKLSKEKQQILATQNETLERQVTERTTALNQSLENLKATQTQLIQKEKLASLGELTAGIAHEIQNPLNFVNNFSDLSIDLIKDIKNEKQKPIEKRDEVYENELLSDLSANQEKINHHGKRASGIVKGMLEHSRNTVGERQMTDVNNLIKEFLPMSFQSMRAKDQNFNADYQMELDESLEKINIVPQEISRVLVNLFNNAFYAVNEKRISEDGQRTMDDGKNKSNANQLSESFKLSESSYMPTVIVSTKKLENAIEIRVKDNGIGIPESIQQKIFQPFFTTKPPGEGTGLGLSLSYDMITKGHGGTLEVHSTEGVGSEFIIKLPTK